MKALIATTAILLAASSVASSSEPTVSDVLRSISTEINKSLPMMVDKEKQLEATVAAFDTLLFKYKFIDESTISNPRFDKNKYLAALRVSLGESTCNDPATFALLKQGAKYTYMFTNKRGLKLFEYSLDERECTEYRRRSQK